MRLPQARQRPRSSAYESSGTLSYQAIGVSQLMHAEPGETSDRRSGTRAATTFRKLPTARPGQNAIAAIAAVIGLSPRLVVACQTGAASTSPFSRPGRDQLPDGLVIAGSRARRSGGTSASPPPASGS